MMINKFVHKCLFWTNSKMKKICPKLAFFEFVQWSNFFMIENRTNTDILVFPGARLETSVAYIGVGYGLEVDFRDGR